jgi:Na+/H+ antiporter NhaD/arsenite permease-like protein
VNISLFVLAAVFGLIAARTIGGLPIRIWQAMCGGALVVLATGQIRWREALAAIDPDVMLFLFGMFVLGHALVASGYLYYLAYRGFSRIRSAQGLVLMVLFGGGMASALLMNDTVAIVGTPLVLRLAREHDLDPRMMLLALAFAVTLGSVPSPIGNPQNLLIATETGLPEPFLTFLGTLGLPTLLNLALAWLWLRWIYRSTLRGAELVHTPVDVLDPRLAKLARIGLWIMVGLIAWSHLPGGERGMRLSWIALAAAAPVLLFSSDRRSVLCGIDWPTLAFFPAMFVLMASVWQSGAIPAWIGWWSLDLKDVLTVLGLSAGLSQLISNVPLVALYLPMLQEAGTSTGALMALAAGSTVAGNFLILGAASNVIIIQHAEKHQVTLGFHTFAMAGVPLALANLAIYWGWLSGFHPFH